MSSTPSSPLDRPRLAKVLALLQSTEDGEALSAARRATAMVREAGTTWAAVVGADHAEDPDRFGARQVIQHPQRGALAPPVGRTWRESLRWLCSRRAGQDDRENEFLDRLSQKLEGQYGYGAPFISPGQAAWATDIYRRATGVPVDAP